MERIPITFKRFMSYFKGQAYTKTVPMILLHILAIYSLPYEKAIDAFDSFIEGLEATDDSHPGRQGAIEAYRHLKQAYLKMTPEERLFIRLKLSDPEIMKTEFNEIFDLTKE